MWAGVGRLPRFHLCTKYGSLAVGWSGWSGCHSTSYPMPLTNSHFKKQVEKSTKYEMSMKHIPGPGISPNHWQHLQKLSAAGLHSGGTALAFVPPETWRPRLLPQALRGRMLQKHSNKNTSSARKRPLRKWKMGDKTVQPSWRLTSQDRWFKLSSRPAGRRQDDCSLESPRLSIHRGNLMWPRFGGGWSQVQPGD